MHETIKPGHSLYGELTRLVDFRRIAQSHPTIAPTVFYEKAALYSDNYTRSEQQKGRSLLALPGIQKKIEQATLKQLVLLYQTEDI